MDRLRELQTLTAIIDTGSLAAAARRLHRSTPSVSRDLADLEARLGCTLVERTTRRCRPTLAAERLADGSRRLLQDYADALREASDQASAPSGTIRVTAPLTFGSACLAPLLFEFLDARAGMSIDLHLSDRLIDLVDEDFDLAVRICGSAEIPPGGRQVGELRRLLVASPLYLADRGVPRRPSDLRRHDFVQHRGLEFRQGWFAERLTGVDERLSGARLTTAQSEAAVAAARHGLGLVSALAHQVHADLRSGALVEVLGDFAPEPLVVALVSPPNRRSRRPVRLLTEDLAPRLTEALISLGGRQKDRTSAPRPVVQLDAERSH